MCSVPTYHSREIRCITNIPESSLLKQLNTQQKPKPPNSNHSQTTLKHPEKLPENTKHTEYPKPMAPNKPLPENPGKHLENNQKTQTKGTKQTMQTNTEKTHPKHPEIIQKNN